MVDCVHGRTQIFTCKLRHMTQTLTRTIIVHRSVDGIIIVINICSVRQKDGKKWTKQYNNEESLNPEMSIFCCLCVVYVLCMWRVRNKYIIICGFNLVYVYVLSMCCTYMSCVCLFVVYVLSMCCLCVVYVFSMCCLTLTLTLTPPCKEADLYREDTNHCPETQSTNQPCATPAPPHRARVQRQSAENWTTTPPI